MAPVVSNPEKTEKLTEEQKAYIERVVKENM